MSLPDTFTASDSTALSTYDATWVKHAEYSSGACDIQGGMAHLSTYVTGVCYYYNSAPSDADYDVWADIYAPAASESLVAVAGRISNGTNTMYFARVNAGNMQLYKIVSNTATQLGSSVAVSFSNGETHSVRLSMSGTTIKAYFDDVEKISVTDSSISAAGYAGFRYVASSNSKLDNFNFGTYGSGATDLTVADASHTHTADSPTLTTSYTDLSVADALHAHAADNVVLEVVGTTNLTVADATHAHTADNVVLTTVPTLTTEVLKNNTGTVLANETGATAYVYNISTGALVVAVTGCTTDASGVMTISDAALSSATEYRVVVVLSGGAEGMAKYTTA